MTRTHRSWFVLLAVVLIMVAGCSNSGRHAVSTGTAIGPSRSASPSPTLADHRAATRAEVDRLTSALRLPLGAKHLTGQPADWPRSDAEVGPGTSDEIERTTWFRAPGNRDDAESFVRANPPTGFRSDGSSGYDSNGVHFLDFYPHGLPEDPAYTNLTVDVSLHEAGGATTLRYTVRASTRAVRDPRSLVAGTVTTVQVLDDPGAPFPDQKKKRSVQRRTITDAQDIARLVSTANSLLASSAVPIVISCPLIMSPPPHDRISFTGPEGTWVFDWYPSCFGQITVTRDGTALKPTLEPDDLGKLINQMLNS